MSNKTDSNIYTILFAIGMVVVVGALLAFTAASLKPTIAENERMEKQQHILYAMGVNDNGESDVAGFYMSDTFKTLFPDRNSYTATLHIKPHTGYIPTFYQDKINNDTWIVYPWER